MGDGRAGDGRGRRRGRDRDVGEEEEEERFRVCKEGKSCDAPRYLLARRQLGHSLFLRCQSLRERDIKSKAAILSHFFGILFWGGSNSSQSAEMGAH